VTLPIIIDGRHLATFLTERFFHDDDEVDEQFLRAQAAEFGFDKSDYLTALRRMPVFTREKVRNIMDFYHNLVNILVGTGLKIKLAREVEDRKQAENRNWIQIIFWTR
jgi:ligand-binding sensor protein